MLTEHERQIPHLYRFPSQEHAHFMGCSLEQRGFIEALRDYSYHQGGIVNDERLIDNLRRIAGSLVTKRRIKTLWLLVGPKFTLVGGRFVYARDEARRGEADSQ